jgi:hypothetical protein
MCRSDQEKLEDRIFELLDTHVSGREICEELGLELNSGIDLILKVFDERGTPNLVEARAAIDRLAAIRY